MVNRKLYTFILAALALTGCSDDIANEESAANTVELTTINAYIESGTKTRSASDVVYLEDHISRYQFMSGDKMTFTKIERTSNPIKRFQYRDVVFNRNSSDAWERDKETGGSVEYPNVHPDRIYWSDATSTHTFVGFSLPKDNTPFDWKLNNDTYYGAIGNPLDASEVIDYNPASPATETITVTDGKEEKEVTFGYSQKLRDEDLLLTYDDQLRADNSVANIKFRHALSSVRIIVNISGFYGTTTDAYSKVSDMILKSQPTLYQWKQTTATVEALTIDINTTLQQETMWGASAPAYDQRKDIKLWNTKPEGEGSGAGKLFTFYGITVPQGTDFFTAFPGYKNLEMSFKVTYPDPMKDNPETQTTQKTYTAKLANPVNFYPGKCTTIHINLNHKNETMTIGASYQDWEYEDTPDEGALKKKETFLSKAPELAQRDKAGVTIVDDDKATADDATWLYEKKDQGGNSLGIFDISGNDGSETSPYTISTANQLLSFAYEVHSGRTFAGKYVKLDADITLQPSSSVKDSERITWIGIGNEDGTKMFEGIFNGNGRRISGLYGHPFFGVIGYYAVVDKLNFANVIGITNDGGVVAHKNRGLLCGTNIESNITIQASNTNQYVGSIVGDNESFIVACTHTGTVEATSGTNTTHIGGIVGRNNGTIISTYHAGTVKGNGSADVHPAIGYVCKKENGNGENDSQVFSCYFNNNYNSTPVDLIPGMNAFPRTTGQMQSNSFVNATTEIIPVEDGIGNEGDDLRKHHYSLNQAMVIFKQWIDSIVDSKKDDTSDWEIETNCHKFNERQVRWLQSHYTETHRFGYTPGAYPKVQ